MRPKKKTAGVEESKDGEVEEEDDNGETLWEEVEGKMAGQLDIKTRGKDDLGLDALVGFDFVEPDDAFWDNIGKEAELWLDHE